MVRGFLYVDESDSHEGEYGRNKCEVRQESMYYYRSGKANGRICKGIIQEMCPINGELDLLSQH
jgi:hypothetical protein